MLLFILARPMFIFLTTVHLSVVVVAVCIIINHKYYMMHNMVFFSSSSIRVLATPLICGITTYTNQTHLAPFVLFISNRTSLAYDYTMHVFSFSNINSFFFLRFSHFQYTVQIESNRLIQKAMYMFQCMSNRL